MCSSSGVNYCIVIISLFDLFFNWKREMHIKVAYFRYLLGPITSSVNCTTSSLNIYYYVLITTLLRGQTIVILCVIMIDAKQMSIFTV